MSKTAEIKDGIFYLDKRPVFLASADYPYYRDDPKNWNDRLRKIKAAGIDVVTFYTPWRHHMLKIGERFVADFDGNTRPNRNVKLFMKLCVKNKLWMVVKPGPFIHAETNYGGLPDWVSPEDDAEIEPIDKAQRWLRGGKLLPAPLCRKFKGMVKKWHASVYKNILKENIYPKGNVIAVQVCNEGLYSNAPAPLTGYDYSPSSLALYRKFAGDGKARVPRNFPGVSDKSELKCYLKWAEWQSEFMRLIYDEYSSPIKSAAPFVVNINPPGEGNGLDHWLTRIIPERWPNVNYGFTNWLKPVSEDRSSFERYSLLSKRKRGINWEENWGFSKLYDSRFRYPVVCVFETFLAVANGATGFNVYTAVNTACWDDSIDDKHKRPYPDSAPIREDGALTKKHEILSLMTRFFKELGADFLNAKADHDVAWGLYPPYAYLAAWNIPRDDWKKIGFEAVKCGHEGLDRFQRTLRSKNRDFQILNIETASAEEFLRHKNIVLRGGFFMDRKTQNKLRDYMAAGGRLIFVGNIPSRDENFRRYGILRKGAIRLSRMASVLNALAGADSKLKVRDPATQVWVYENSGKSAQFFFVFNLSPRPGIREFSYSGKPVKITLPQKSVAAIKVKSRKLDAVFIKGVNEMHKSSVIPEVSFGKDRLKADFPCDLLAMRQGNKWQMKAAGILILMAALVISAPEAKGLSVAEAGNIPLIGHGIAVDKSIADWIGAAPAEENTVAINNGEYIWKDAVGDDKGSGGYSYPLNKALKKGADLREFRVTCDKDKLYFFIKMERPGDWWTGYKIIGIHKEGSEGGMAFLAQGDENEYNFDSGTFANLRVSPDLSCQYVIAISSTYKGRIWGADGKLIARKEAQPEDTPGFEILDSNWNAIEISISWDLIGGNAAGQTWKFIVATGQQENDIARRIEEKTSEWHGGGGSANGENPNVYDLAGADKTTQEKELGSYDPKADTGNPEGFAAIDKSYLIVNFGAIK